MDFVLFCLLIILTIWIILYFYLQKKFSYWSSRGIPGPRPSLFTVGTELERLLYGPERYEPANRATKFGKVFGHYRGLIPALTVNDPELIKQVLIKDFGQNMSKPGLSTYDFLWNENLFVIGGENWKRIRDITSPAFTGAKLKVMQQTMNRFVSNLVDYFDKIVQKTNGKMYPKVGATGFTIDVLTSTMFSTQIEGISSLMFQLELQQNPQLSRDSIVDYAIQLFHINRLKVFLANFIFTKQINQLLGIGSIFLDRSFRHFGKLSEYIYNQRKSNESNKSKPKNLQNDLLQMLMEAQTTDGPKNLQNDRETIAQCFIFLTAGFETTVATLTHCLYELAMNPRIQERLFQELEVLDQFELNTLEHFDTVMSRIPYLEAVIKETLRKYPPFIRLERSIGHDGYQLGDLKLDKNTVIEISTYGVQHNPEYYPEPELFNPDRFLPESAHHHHLTPYTFLSFGIGPRNCIGMRFAYQELKLCLAQLVRKFAFEQTDKTPQQLSFRGASLLLTAYPFEIQIRRREF